MQWFCFLPNLDPVTAPFSNRKHCMFSPNTGSVNPRKSLPLPWETKTILKGQKPFWQNCFSCMCINSSFIKVRNQTFHFKLNALTFYIHQHVYGYFLPCHWVCSIFPDVFLYQSPLVNMSRYWADNWMFWNFIANWKVKKIKTNINILWIYV